MNKLVATTLESNFHVFDLRTQHEEKGFASVSLKVCLQLRLSQGKENSTAWAVKHLPQNRDVFVVSSGNGNLALYK